MPTTPTAAFYKDEAHLDWGLGLVVEEQPDRWVLVFEHAGRKVFIKSKSKTVVPAEVEVDRQASLESKLRGKHSTGSRAKPKAKKPSKTPAVFITFDRQFKLFETMFPGGFEGERFIAEERGAPGTQGKAGLKQAGIALAREELAPARFSSAAPADLFASAKRVLAATNLAFPIEGAVPFGAIPEADRPAVLTALQNLLHGEGVYGARLEQFAHSVHLKDSVRTGKRVTWALATLFAALYAPDEHTFVKPPFFAAQGATLGLDIDKSQPVTAEGYLRFFGVAQQTRQRLLDASQRPRDFVDVYSFISRTHKEKPA